MKATVTNKRGCTIVSFEGFLNYSHPDIVKEQIRKIYASKRNKKIIFNLSGLQFIGSSGLKPFIQMLRELNKSSVIPKYCGVSTEFRRLLKAYQGRKRFQVFDSELEAIRSYRIIKKPGRA